MADTSANPATSVLDFAWLLLDVLGFTDSEFVSLGHQKPGRNFRTAVREPADAVRAAANASATANEYFGVNPVRGPVREDAGRGKEADVTRLAALVCDLDVKQGACPSLDVARTIVVGLSELLGTRPSAIVESGHGLHAYWPISDGQIINGDIGPARALTRRWGRLVAAAADRHVVHVDNVFDLPRVLRIPGSFNCKVNGQAPARVVGHPDVGGPLSMAEADERLTEFGIPEEDEDRADRERVSDPVDWVFAATTCSYMSTFIDGLPSDGPKTGGGRHQWLVKQAVRLACGRRLGCITETDHQRAEELLGTPLAVLRAATGEQVGRFEVANAVAFGVEAAAAKTDDQVLAELGGHPHYSDTQPGFDEPIPLIGNVVEVPPFPVDALPAVFAHKVAGLAEATQTDPAMAGTSALSVLSACVGGHARIVIRDGWSEPLCLYTNTIASPGERKSAVQASMVRPLHDAEADLSVAAEVNRLEQQDAQELAKKTVDRLNKIAVDAAAKAAAPGATDEDRRNAAQTAQAARDAKQVMRGIEVPEVPRLLADDTTPEAAATLLSLHGGRIAVISAEGGIFDTLAGRYARVVNIDVFLKGHSGDPIRVDRQGRPSQHIPSPALTMGLMVQPRVIETIAANRDFVGRGLLARFLYAQPVSRVGHRRIAATPVSRAVEHEYSAAVKKLASRLAGWAGDPAVLMLHPLAEAEVRRIEADVEPTLAGAGALASPSSLAEWGNKYAGAVVRIAGLPHLGEHGEAGPKRSVSAETVRAAERVGGYFKATAINVFTRMADPDVADAVYLLDRVASLHADEVSERDIFRAANCARFPTKPDMMPALNRLIDHGYLLPLQQQTRKPAGGRPPALRYRVHPYVSQNCHNRHNRATERALSAVSVLRQ